MAPMTADELARRLGNDARGYDSDTNVELLRTTIPSTVKLAVTAAMAGLTDARLLSSEQLTTEQARDHIASPNKDTGYLRYIQFLLANPVEVKNIQIQTGTADCLAGMSFKAQRITPFGMQVSNQVDVSSYQTPNDYQSTRAQVPVSALMDGHSHLTITTPAVAVAETVNLTLMIGNRAERIRTLILGDPIAVGEPKRVQDAGRSPDLKYTHG